MRSRRADAPTRPPLPKGFGVIWTTVAIDLIGFGIVLPILPRYAEEFGATPIQIGFLVASFSFAQMLAAPVMGKLSDRYGRKPVLLFSLVGTAVGSLLTGLAGALPMLFLGRLIDGASGASVSVAQASVTDIATPEERPRLLGLLGAAFGVGFVLGPAIGALAALGGSHVPFFVAAAISAVNALVAVRRLPETRRAGIHATVAGPVDDAEVPVVDPDAGPVDRTGLNRLALAAFMAVTAFAGFEATFSLLTGDRFGLTISQTGLAFVLIGILLVAVQGGLVGRANAALGEDATIRIGMGLNVCGLLLLVPDGGWLTLVPGVAMLTVGQGLLTPTLVSAASHRSGAERGRYLGWQQSAGALARIVGPILATSLYEGVGVGAPYAVAAVLLLVGFVALPASGLSRSVTAA